MHTIQVHDKTFTTYLSEEQLQNRIKELAAYINKDFEGKKLFSSPY